MLVRVRVTLKWLMFRTVCLLQRPVCCTHSPDCVFHGQQHGHHQGDHSLYQVRTINIELIDYLDKVLHISADVQAMGHLS
jgi:hypothetical protein